MGDFIPQTPSLGPCPQTPSSLRAYRSFLSENSMRRYLDAQDAIRDFFFSPSFHVLSDLNGRKLLKRLDQEVL